MLLTLAVERISGVEMSAESMRRYQFRRLLDELASKRGRGTELISVYITPDFDLNKVVQQLREEQGTAANIKSKSTRKNVIGALEKIIQFLRTYIDVHKRPPPNGMAIFCGNVAGREDIADIQLYWVEPPEPITTRMYRCDQEFVLEPLREMLQVKETIGLLVLDRREATLATLRGKHIDIIRTLTSGVPGKHRHGGQSARRFERLIEIAAYEFLKRIAEAANEAFSQVPDLRAVLIGGPGPTKEEFLKSELLRDDIRKKVVALVDTGYTDEQGIKELVNKSGEVLADLDIMKEKSLMQRFMSELVSGDGLVAYGEDEVRRALERGAVQLLLISEALRRHRVLVRCQGCGHELQETVEDLEIYKRQLASKPCPNCGETKLSIAESRDMVQELCELADRFGAEVEFISTETEEGKQLQMAFKGLAALLRFRVS
jgi:peptide chain release factor subunit 1